MSTPVKFGDVTKLPPQGELTPPGDGSPPYSHARVVLSAKPADIAKLQDEQDNEERQRGLMRRLGDEAGHMDTLKRLENNEYLNPRPKGGRKRKSKKTKRTTRKGGRRRTRSRKTRSTRRR